MKQFSNLAIQCVVSIVIAGGLLTSGEAQADQPIQQTISGDSRSIDPTPVVAEASNTRRAADKRPDTPKLICKKEKVTGSHMRQKVCRSQTEIDAQRERGQRSLRDMAATGTGAPD